MRLKLIHVLFRPVIEMTIPSSIDPTLAPPGCHVIQVFVQYVPYTLAGGQQWTDQLKEEFADRGMFCCIYGTNVASDIFLCQDKIFTTQFVFLMICFYDITCIISNQTI